MAERVSVVLIDDIDDSEAAETVTFGIDGVNYQIDLSSGNAQKLRDALALYIAHGRRAGGRRTPPAAKSTRSRRSKREPGSGPAPSEIRAWGRSNGWEVPDRGRVSEELRTAYLAAH